MKVLLSQKIKRNRSFSMCANFPKNNIYPLIRTRMYAYQGVNNVSFSVNFAYVLNELKFAAALHLYVIQKV